MSAAGQLTRIVQLVAELSRGAREEAEAPTLAELAGSFAVTPVQIAADLRALTLLGEHADADWLLSLRVWQQRDRVSVSSAGPFRRPMRLSPEEGLAVQAALLLEGAVELAARFAPGTREPSATAAPAVPPEPATVTDRLLAACHQRRRARIRYASEGKTEAADWEIEIHQVVEYTGWMYWIAWGGEGGGWRRFRDDRVLDATVLEARFEPREDFEPVGDPRDLFQAAGEPEQATIRYSPRVARWLRERHPEHQNQPDGSIRVRVPVANPHWLVRRVLEYGPDAEVVEPESFRALVRGAVA